MTGLLLFDTTVISGRVGRSGLEYVRRVAGGKRVSNEATPSRLKHQKKQRLQIKNLKIILYKRKKKIIQQL